MADDAAAKRRAKSEPPAPVADEHQASPPPVRRSDELNEVLSVLKQKVAGRDEYISRLKAEAETQAREAETRARMHGEELRMLDDEHNTAEAAAAHENQMLRLDLRTQSRKPMSSLARRCGLTTGAWDAARSASTTLGGSSATIVIDSS